VQQRAQCLDLAGREVPDHPLVHLQAQLVAFDGDPLADVRILQDKTRIAEVIKAGDRIDLTTPIPEHGPRTSDQVRFLAACPLTRSLAFKEEQLERMSHV